MNNEKLSGDCHIISKKKDNKKDKQCKICNKFTFEEPELYIDGRNVSTKLILSYNYYTLIYKLIHSTIFIYLQIMESENIF